MGNTEVTDVAQQRKKFLKLLETFPFLYQLSRKWA